MITLKPGNEYTLKYSGQFCHSIGAKGYKRFSKNENFEDRILAVFVGQVYTGAGLRNIFYDARSNNRAYIMFSTDKIDYIDESLASTSGK